MIKFKDTATPLEMSIVSNAVEVEPNRIEFGNATFGCKEIKDAAGNVFTKIIHCKDCRHHNFWGACVKIAELTDARKTFCTSDTFHCGYAEQRGEQ